MTGETNLNVLLETMQPVLQEGVYVFHPSNISFKEAAAHFHDHLFLSIDAHADDAKTALEAVSHGK